MRSERRRQETLGTVDSSGRKETTNQARAYGVLSENRIGCQDKAQNQNSQLRGRELPLLSLSDLVQV